MVVMIDFESETPIYTQLKDQIVIGIARGELLAGEQLPSVRRMAADIGINAHTVNKAYAMLRDEGFLNMDRRSGCFVPTEQVKTDESFEAALRERLLPIAAEAVCRGMTPEDFSKLCGEVIEGFDRRRL